MEGWDGEPSGMPTELTLRRWRNFGLSGAKLIWGGEAAAVMPQGRANPHQIMAIDACEAGIRELLVELTSAHCSKFGSDDDLLVGLQLTHSGRFSKPRDKQRAEPRIAYHNPLLDQKFGIDPLDQSVVFSDDELEHLIDAYVAAAGVAARAGFRFVDVKACHGYLLHEFLSARTRPGRFGGDFEGRTRLLRTIIRRIRAQWPELMIGVRLSVFDIVPYATSREVGQPMDFASLLPYTFAFGCDESNPLQMDLAEPIELLKLLHSDGVAIVNLSCGSPYYNPHIQRPAIFPPSDGYQPPEDPLVGVARQIDAVRQCKQAVPALPLVGSGYSYLQDYLPHVAEAVLERGWVDFVGLGRMVLSYPELPADVLAGKPLARKKVCRTFSDCTTAPRHGMVSGCYPLDDFYRDRPERETINQVKQALRD
jgi:2,4-dienoyl-CoA reductase-like NADH-dependent reductase (Old Yellow Enzyme family)